MTSKHTPTPWECEPFANPKWRIVFIGPNETHRVIATLDNDIGGTGYVNVVFILQAVNCHEDLLEVAQTLLDYVGPNGNYRCHASLLAQLREKAWAAVTKAEASV